MPVLESYRGRDIIGVEELAGVANSLIEHYGREAAQGPARTGITPRTVRHYLSEALLGEPTGQTGASIIFNYGNLLRLLAVKKLLADHWSVVKVKEFMRQLDITGLEEMVNNALVSFKARQPGEARQGTERDTTRHLRGTEPLSLEQESASQSNLFAVEPARRREPEVGEWIEIAPGLEIKVRRSFRPPASEEDRARLAMRFWSVVMKDDASD
ncbi:MAG TPA: MerR family transcriptional regulator [Pyrinomonadaceae bacterium]|nr:MerR family transcriptional regulator [Pyrinomonadaceae bacterium]